MPPSPPRVAPRPPFLPTPADVSHTRRGLKENPGACVLSKRHTAATQRSGLPQPESYLSLWGQSPKGLRQASHLRGTRF